MRIHKLTYILLGLVFATLGLALTNARQTPRNTTKNEDPVRVQKNRARFPTADYEEPELSDPKKNKALKEKKIRKNDFRIVARNPADWQAERVFIDEGGIPALPVVESKFIIIGTVNAAEAHVSENKKNVYSEFTVLVEKVLKTASGSITQGSQIAVDRVGGWVKYPTGRTILYRVARQNMPAVGQRYVFFLTSKNDQDISILTGYALTPSGTDPLDDSPQFDQYLGLTEEVFIENLQQALAKSLPN